ncbi:pyridoxamine 5'-phosphate oxidase family protein [Streptomyces sp. T12]|uniref:pyridoxamine 5'-phosphate oxidase family protein n=1 Tax=Streptomyces sp. T12 TaxID=477697 RepID=UPI0035A2A2C3
MAEQVESKATEAAPVGDLGRRIARRRTELGLSREETATRAGMALSHLLSPLSGGASGRRTGHGRAPCTGGGPAHHRQRAHRRDTDLPPGTTPRACRRPGIAELPTRECRALLSTHGVGRIAVPTVTGPVSVPVNYSVVNSAIVFRTAPVTTPSQASGCQAAFEIDRIDDVFIQGWSVLVRGHARAVTDPDEIRAARPVGANRSPRDHRAADHGGMGAFVRHVRD